MYISNFTCGVIFTILAEIAFLVGFAIYQTWKKRK